MKITFSAKMYITIVFSTIILFSCNNSPYPGYDMNEDGLYSKFYNHDENGVKPKEGEVVRVIIKYSVNKGGKDTVLFDSNDPAFNRGGPNYAEFPVAKPAFKGCFEDALMLMSVGDSASFIIHADSVYLKTFLVDSLPPFIESGSMMTFDVKLLKISTQEEALAERQKAMDEQMAIMKEEEKKKLEAYITENKITTKPTESGLYYIEIKKGSGPKPSMGDLVLVNYTGRFIDGTVFDTNNEAIAKEIGAYNPERKYEPVEFALGEVIQGWNEALALMSAGTKAKLIIPSSIGYGQGSRSIPPFATLTFEVELISFKKATK